VQGEIQSPESKGTSVSEGQPSSPDSKRYLAVPEVAESLGVSESWVRRHIAELPAVRVGRLVRFDASLLSERINGRMSSGKSLKPERASMPSRYQRGFVLLRGSTQKVWYGMFREDVRNPDGQIERRLRKIRLGTLAELPTKNAARNKLTELLGVESKPMVVDMTFKELVERWEKAEGPTIKSASLLHYRNALRMYVMPVFGRQTISAITREGIQRFLADKAKTYSRSALRSMRTVLSLTLGWALSCGWIQANPCVRIKLPLVTGGKRVTRVVLAPTQITDLASRLEEPYATLVLLLAATGLRIGEAIGVKWSDIDGNVLSVSRRIYIGDVDSVKTLTSVRRLPLDPKLVERLRVLGEGNEWVFRSRAGTPINPGNGLKRYVRPAAKSLGIVFGGWHDFRHTLSTTLRRSGVHPKVVSDILGHKKVNLAMDVYDRTDVGDFEQPLEAVSNRLLPNVTQSENAA
jgi:excisionase family DNA binding protein